MKFNVFVKPNEQSRACASYAEAGKMNELQRFVKPIEREPNAVSRLCHGRENELVEKRNEPSFV